MKIHSLPTPALPHGPLDPQQKVSQSCRQFEAGIWRGMLEEALAMPKSSGSDVYSYLMTDKIADKIAGQPGSFAQALAAQLNRKPGAKSADSKATSGTTTAADKTPTQFSAPPKL